MAYDNLLAKYIHIKCGRECEICGTEYPDETYIMPVHIFGKGAFPKLRYIDDNIVGGCDDCHKGLDENKNNSQKLIKKRVAQIKGFKTYEHLEEHLYILNRNLPLVKNQNVKESINKQIREVNK